MRKTPQLLTTLQAAQILGKSHDTVTRLAAAGEIAATKMPGRTGSYIFTPESVEAYLHARSAEVAS